MPHAVLMLPSMARAMPQSAWSKSAVAERNLTISTSTIVTSKDARALAEGLGIHVPGGSGDPLKSGGKK